MKKLLAFVMILTLMCTMLTSCGNAERMIAEANSVLNEAPYAMTMKLNFECDNKSLMQSLSAMNMEIPLIVDGHNMSMDMTMNIMGDTANAKIIVADRVAYYNIAVMDETVKMKVPMSEQQYAEFISENNAQPVLEPEAFEKLTVASKNGKKYISGHEIGEDALTDMNRMMEDYLESLNCKANAEDITFVITLSDGKYEKIEVSCVYTVTVGAITSSVTFHMSSEFTYGSYAKITAPADAARYQEIDYDELFD